MTAPEFQVRAALPADVAALRAIEETAFPDDTWSEHSLSEATSGGRWLSLIAESEGHACGHAVGWSVDDEGELARLALLPAWRGRGLGARLLQAFEQECAHRGARRLFLEVRADNPIARRLYERSGWREVGVRREYYPDGVDAIVMTREVDVAGPSEPAGALWAG